MKKITFTFLVSIIMAFNVAAQDRLFFVSPTGNNANTGLTWETSYLTVMEALLDAAATAGNHKIYVKQGTYAMSGVGNTFINKSLTLQGGFPTAAAGIDITGYSAALTTTLDYNKFVPSTGTIIIQNTVAGSYTVEIKGLTTERIGLTGVANTFFFRSIVPAGTVNTAFSFTDMRHVNSNTLTTASAGSGTGATWGVQSVYDLENITSGSIALTNCFFGSIRNTTSPYGLALTLRNSAVAPSITTCTFNDVQNAGGSGIVWLEDIDASPIATIATDNIIINGNISNQFVLRGNTGDFIVDGIIAPINNNDAGTTNTGSFVKALGDILNPGKITIKNCTITNTASGGTIAIASSSGRGDVEISGNTFTNNINASTIGGGAIHISGAAAATPVLSVPNVTISGNTFTGNQSSGEFGGAVAFYGNGTTNNTFKAINLDNNAFMNNSSGNGALGFQTFLTATVINITNSSFTGNTAIDFGGAIAMSSTIDAPVNLLTNTFCGNKVTAGPGGAISLASFSTTNYPLTITDCIFNANIATSSSGAIHVNDYPSIHINTSTFSENGSSGAGAGTISFTGVKFNSEIDQCVFVRNVSNAGIAGIFITRTTAAAGVTFDITKCNFTQNTTRSGNAAGALVIASTFNTPVYNVNDCIFDGNSTNTGGGAINVAAASTNVLVNTCVFKNNYSGFNPLATNVADADISSNVTSVQLTTTIQPTISNSYLQSALTLDNYKAANIPPTNTTNTVISSAQTFFSTGTNGCAAVPLVYQLNQAVTGVIDCSKTQLSPAPVVGVASQLDLIVTVNVTAAGEFTPIVLSGSGMSLANGVTSVVATTTGTQQFHIPVKYDGTALGTLNFTIGSLTECTADLTLAPKSAICPIWTLDNCSPVQVGPALK